MNEVSEVKLDVNWIEQSSKKVVQTQTYPLKQLPETGSHSTMRVSLIGIIIVAWGIGLLIKKKIGGRIG